VIRVHSVLIGIVSLFSTGLLIACGSQSSATAIPALATPAVPTPISVPSTQRLILKARGVGVQIYACRANPGQTGGSQGYGWVLKGPDASLLDTRGVKIGKHYEGPTWEMNDGSKVVGMAQATVTAPDGDNIPWLLLESVQNEGTGEFARVRTVQRIQTVGGKAPVSGCDSATLEREVRVPYEAAYYFYVDAA
jgi:hypothetical protein